MPRQQARRGSPVLLGIVLAVALVGAAPPAQGSGDHERRASTWHASWATAQHTTAPPLVHQTVRTVVHLTQGGRALRMAFANHASDSPITIGPVVVGRRKGERGMSESSSRRVTFDGRRMLTLEPGERRTSDPVRLRTGAQRDVLVDSYVRGIQTPSAHRTAFDTSYLTPPGSGNHVGEASGTTFVQTTDSYLMLSAVDVADTDIVGTVAVVGGSVVDGQGSRSTGTLGTGPEAPPNSPWSDVLARRLLHSRRADRQVSVVNAGIGGNTASSECAVSPGRAGNLQQRFGRDVLSRAGLTHVLVYAGTNDLGVGAGCTARQIIRAFKDLARRTHRAGADIVVASVTPRASYTPEQNRRRARVNRWILRSGDCSGRCDGVADFDKAIAWPAYPDAIDPSLDSGDGVHPNAEGYARMGRAVPLAHFRQRS